MTFITWTQEAWEEIMRARRERKTQERLEELEEERDEHDCFDVVGASCPCSDQCKCTCGRCGCCR